MSFHIPKPKRGRYMTPRTASFFDTISRELNWMSGQTILLYQYSGEHSTNDDLYRESKSKRYEDPIQVMCNVGIDPTTSNNNEGYGQEQSTALQLYIQRTELLHLSEEHDRTIYPNEGDIVIFKQRVFEVTNVDDSEMYSGSPEYPYTLVVNCNKVRKSKISFDLPKDFY